VPLILPALDGVAGRLQAGALVAVGCGSGVAVCTMAAAFPGSRFEGLDPSQHAIGRARRRAAGNGLENAEFRTAGAEDLPGDSRCDFVMTLDCLHDMARPAEAAAAIRRAVRPDSAWLIKDIRSGPAWQDNLRNPVLALMYGLSVTSCLSSGLSEPGGAGLGTLGPHPGLAEQMCRETGFSRFPGTTSMTRSTCTTKFARDRAAERGSACRRSTASRHRPVTDAFRRANQRRSRSVMFGSFFPSDGSPTICLSSEREQQVSARANCPVRCGTGNERQPGYPSPPVGCPVCRCQML
jgi:SAM-dependent methyltransferase